MKQIHCEQCGAPMKPHADGRRYFCEHCAAERQVAIDTDQLAAGLRLDLGNVELFVHELAASMVRALPDRTRVVRDGARIVLLEINLDPHLYATRREAAGHFTAQYKKLVRGVALKTKVLPLPSWVEQLTAAIAEHANQNAELALVLAQLRGP